MNDRRLPSSDTESIRDMISKGHPSITTVAHLWTDMSVFIWEKEREGDIVWEF